MKKVMLGLCGAAALVLGNGGSWAQELPVPEEAIGLIAEAFNVPGSEPVEYLIIEVQRRGEAKPEMYRYTAVQPISASAGCVSSTPHHWEGNPFGYLFVWCRESSGKAQRDTVFGVRLIQRLDEIPCVVDETKVGNPAYFRLSRGAFNAVC